MSFLLFFRLLGAKTALFASRFLKITAKTSSYNASLKVFILDAFWRDKLRLILPFAAAKTRPRSNKRLWKVRTRQRFGSSLDCVKEKTKTELNTSIGLLKIDLNELRVFNLSLRTLQKMFLFFQIIFCCRKRTPQFVENDDDLSTDWICCLLRMVCNWIANCTKE